MNVKCNNKIIFNLIKNYFIMNKIYYLIFYFKINIYNKIKNNNIEKIKIHLKKIIFFLVE